MPFTTCPIDGRTSPCKRSKPPPLQASDLPARLPPCFWRLVCAFPRLAGAQASKASRTGAAQQARSKFPQAVPPRSYPISPNTQAHSASTSTRDSLDSPPMTRRADRSSISASSTSRGAAGRRQALSDPRLSPMPNAATSRRSTLRAGSSIATASSTTRCSTIAAISLRTSCAARTPTSVTSSPVRAR